MNPSPVEEHATRRMLFIYVISGLTVWHCAYGNSRLCEYLKGSMKETKYVPQLWNWENHSQSWRGRIYRVAWFFCPRSSCRMYLMLFSERPPNASSCMTISGGRTEQL